MTGVIWQSKASATRMPHSSARALSTGSTPGKPRQTGQVWLFGAAPKAAEHPQNSLVAVLNCRWTSSPMTGS